MQMLCCPRHTTAKHLHHLRLSAMASHDKNSLRLSAFKLGSCCFTSVESSSFTHEASLGHRTKRERPCCWYCLRKHTTTLAKDLKPCYQKQHCYSRVGTETKPSCQCKAAPGCDPYSFTRSPRHPASMPSTRATPRGRPGPARAPCTRTPHRQQPHLYIAYGTA